MEQTKKQKMVAMIEKLRLSLKNHPKEWVCTEYVLKHKGSGVELWMCNGRLYFRIYKPSKVDLPFFKARKLYKDACKFWTKNTMDYNEKQLDKSFKIIKNLK